MLIVFRFLLQLCLEKSRNIFSLESGNPVFPLLPYLFRFQNGFVNTSMSDSSHLRLEIKFFAPRGRPSWQELVPLTSVATKYASCNDCVNYMHAEHKGSTISERHFTQWTSVRIPHTMCQVVSFIHTTIVEDQYCYIALSGVTAVYPLMQRSHKDETQGQSSHY